MTTMLELRQLIAENCDFSQPLRVVAHDIGKKAAKHSVVRADEEHPARVTIAPGLYDDRGSIELAYDADASVLMPADFVGALDALLEEVPKARIGWVYFFYFPLDYRFLFGKVRRVDFSLLDTRDVQDIYLSEDEPNTLVFMAKYGIGEFNVSE